MRTPLKYRVRRTIALIVGAALTGALLGLSLEFVWWLDDNNPRAYGAVVGVLSAIAISTAYKIGKEVR